jgi:acetolactate synthase-1/3 small subunit
MRHVLSVLVTNQAGVLSRVSGLFSRRGYNIDSLSVGVAEDPAHSRITVAVHGDDRVIEQIQKQVEKLIDVVSVRELRPEAAVFRELCFIKVAANAQSRPDVNSIVDIFRANIIDVSAQNLTVEITGDQGKLSAFIELMEPYGILEIVRTGLTGISRGAGE